MPLLAPVTTATLFASSKSMAATVRDARSRRGWLREALASFAHQRDGLREHRGHHGAQLLRLLLGRALDVDALDRRDRHVDGELDRVVGPCQGLGGLHVLRHLLHAALELRVVEEPAKAFHRAESTWC